MHKLYFLLSQLSTKCLNLPFFHGVGNIFEDDIPWKLTTLKLLPPVYDYSDLEYEEVEAGRNYWDCDCLLSNFSKVLFDTYIKSKDDNHPDFFFVYYCITKLLLIFFLSIFGTEKKQSQREQQTL